MDRSSRKLLYVTLAYPGDLYSEKSFVDGELEALRKEFGSILLVPADDFGRAARYAETLPDGVSVDWSLSEDPVFHSKPKRLRYLANREVLSALWDMRKEARTPSQWIKGFFQTANIVHISNVIKEIADRHGMTQKNTVLMAMWFHDPAGALARLGLTEGWHVATHAHTSDLYDDRMLFRSHALRSRLLQGLDYVFTISQKGAEYMRNRYPEATEKIIFSPLGSRRLFATAESYTASGTIRFVTVARLQEIKCHDLIMDVLEKVAERLPDRRVVWDVIGDGELTDSLIEKSRKVTPGNFKINFHGASTNEEIQHRFSTNPPDWFIMMSRSEGLPISMGEAMSYGIPIITTDVGDISELVNEECAVLLPAPCSSGNKDKRRDAEEYAGILLPIVTDRDLRIKMGQAAKRRWEEFFDATSRSEVLAKRLGGLL